MTSPRKNSLLWLIGLFPFLLSGCASPSSAEAKAPAIFVDLQVTGGGPPPVQQSSSVYRNLSNDITSSGYRIADTADAADYVLVATFTRDSANPNQWHIAVTGSAPALRSSRDDPESDPTKSEKRDERLRQLEAWAKSRSAPRYP